MCLNPPERWQKGVHVAPSSLEKSKAPLSTATAADRYLLFIVAARRFIDTDIDATKYEETLRELMGIGSYVAFTIDKLLSALVKLAQQIANDDTTVKLISLLSYEAARKEHSTAVYLANTMEVLGEERAFRFEYTADGVLSMTLLDSRDDEGSVSGAAAAAGAATLAHSQMPRGSRMSLHREKWNKFVDQYVSPNVANLDVRKHKIYLPRVHRLRANATTLPALLEESEISYELEARICLSTYKLFYVQDTEDYFHHPSRKTPVASSDEKVARMRARLAERLAAIGGPTASL